MILADEVYQSNIYYPEDHPFISFRKVLAEMGDPYANDVELISMHSISKGLMGECGLRGGYFEAHNLDPFALEMLFKLKSIELCSNTVGQIATNLMVDPPREGREDDVTVTKYKSQAIEIFDGLKERALLLTDAFNAMENVTCNTIEGAMYGFPRVHFHQKALDKATKMGIQPDFMYCMDMVNETGIMTVPGSGFGQKKGDYHYRITNLVTPTENLKTMVKSLKEFNDRFHKKY